MPAKSKAQQRLMATALHNPSKVKNKEVLKMAKKQLKEYAETKTEDLPEKKSNNAIADMREEAYRKQAEAHKKKSSYSAKSLKKVFNRRKELLESIK
ncbi:hypothetical protein KO465_04680 [Candidatus Micrarchaeota archaeon]|jgi:hypothetical protein|nr:hypothetical protein [Candidatus Micrarchaeota archaeon]